MRDETKIAAAPFKLSWPAVFGGMFAATGLWLLLHAFGLAVGLSTLEPDDPSRLRAVGIGTGIWTVVTSMASLFMGGVITARSAGLLGRSNAGLHGFVLWGVTTVGVLALTTTIIASLARDVSRVQVHVMDFSDRTQAEGAASPGAAPEQQPAAPRADTRQQQRADMTVVGARVFWTSFLLMLLSLASSVLGAIAGVTPRQRQLSAQTAMAQLPATPMSGTARPLQM